MRSGWVRKILLVAAGSVFLFSSVMVLKYQLELRAGTRYAQELTQTVVKQNREPAAEKSAENAVENHSDSSALPDDDATAGEPDRMAPIQIDFDRLCAKNEDIVAWLYCPDTPINYPVVQAADNEYYMHRLLDRSRNYAGTLFLDCRNAEDFSDWNSVIYGHNMRNGSMFGTLQKYKQESYFEAHSEIYLLTQKQNYVINGLVGFVTPDDAELYAAFRPSEEDKERLLKAWLKAGNLDAEELPELEQTLITLSTCSYEYDNARFVLIGTLEKIGMPTE